MIYDSLATLYYLITYSYLLATMLISLKSYILATAW